MAKKGYPLIECAALWSEISQLRDWVPISNHFIYWMWQLFPSYVLKACLCMLWETKFGHCYWASRRCVKISIRSSGVKTFTMCPPVSSHVTWWCSCTAILVPPQHCQQTAGPSTAVFSISLFWFLVLYFFSYTLMRVVQFGGWILVLSPEWRQCISFIWKYFQWD